MNKADQNCRIKITQGGSYIVSGHIPLSEKIIVQGSKGYEYRDGRTLPQAATYALCRCGRTKTPPFCDGSHTHFNFRGQETAAKNKFEDRAEWIEGPDLDLLDDNRCAFARFCHRTRGSAWELVEQSDNEQCKSEAIKAASDCPTGRLVAVEKSGAMIEPDYEPEIEILQDPNLGVSGGLFVKGNIQIEAADGHLYEVRNRIVLCRCGQSRNKPFCDATHIDANYVDS